MLWFTSDLHLGHENILRFARRPWKTIDEMNDALIEGINACVQPGDHLYLLGDASFRLTPDKVAGYLKRIACRHVHLVRGNHDSDWSSYGVFESEHDYLELKYHGRKLCLSHYPMMTWNGIYTGSMHLHGHIHSRGSQYNDQNRSQGYFRYDVGVDANGYRPVSFATLEKYYKDVHPVTPRRDNERVGVGYNSEGRPAGPSEVDPFTASMFLADDALGLRLVPADPELAPRVAVYYARNRAYLEAWEPARDDDFFTEERMREVLRNQRRDIDRRSGFHWYLELGDSAGSPAGGAAGDAGAAHAPEAPVVGAVSLNRVSWGAFCSAQLGFRCDEAHAGRGLATAAVRLASAWALGQAGLHRIEASVAPRNAAALAVLRACGYADEGLARRAANVGGVWEDQARLALVSDDGPAADR